MLKYPNPDFKNVVRRSHDGLWSTAFVDLDREPIILSVPAIKNRHYVAQGMNMWTDNFMLVGPRTTGTGAGNFLVAVPKWEDKLPAGVKGATHARRALPGSGFKRWPTVPRIFRP